MEQASESSPAGQLSLLGPCGAGWRNRSWEESSFRAVPSPRWEGGEGSHGSSVVRLTLPDTRSASHTDLIVCVSISSEARLEGEHTDA